MQIKRHYWRAILAMVALGLFIAPWTWLPAPLTLELELRTSRAVRLKLYNLRDGQPREDDCTVTYADARGSFKQYGLPIYGASARALRLQVIPGAAIELRDVSLKRLGRKPVPIAAAAITPASVWCTASLNGATVHVEPTEGATDYHLDFRTDHLPITNARRLEPIITLLLCCCCLGTLAVPEKRRPLSPNRSNCLLRQAIRVRSSWIVGIATAWLIIATIVKLNGSSTGMWRFYAEGRLPSQHFQLGTPKDVRSDEWMVQTPWILSQILREPKFGTFNNSIGDGATTLLTNVPVRHWSMLFRPQFWGFFCLPPELGFAWYWNLKWYVLFVGAFLFFRTLALGDAMIAAAGAALVFFAGYVQWWYSTGACLPEMLGMTFLILWSCRLLMRGQRARDIIAAALLTAGATENFIFCCYPRFQVPLAYFIVITGAAMLMRSGMRKSHRPLRVSCAAAVGLLTVTGTFLWYRELAPLLAATSQLEYPGKIFSVGGGFEWYRFFVPYLEWSMNEFHFPHGLSDACNASGFVLLVPFIVALLWITRRRDAITIALLLFITGIVYFMICGIPAGLARYSGWSMVYDTRGMLPVGISAITCVVRLLSQRMRSPLQSRTLQLIAFLLIAAIFYELLSITNAKYLQFVSNAAVIAIAAYLSLIAALFLSRARMMPIVLLLVPTVLSTGLVNPIGRCLPAFFNSNAFDAVRGYVTRDRTARWVVLGGGELAFRLPHYLTAAGADVLGGTRCNPDTRLMSLIDPQHTYFKAWNRFALVQVDAAPGDEPKVTQTYGLAYTISLPLRDEWLQRLGIRYVVEAGAEPRLPVDRFSEVASLGQLRVLARRN